jgi:hypothetical protein
MPMQKKRVRKKRRSRLSGLLGVLLFGTAVAYLAVVAVIQPERLMPGFARQAAPAIAQAADEEPPGVYALFSYYIAEKLDDYEAYHARHPYMWDEEVVWRVNAGLDKPFFTDPVTTYHPNPLLVNPYNRVPDHFVPQALEYIDNHNRQATPETVQAFARMREAAALAGHHLWLTSAYRTIERQRELYANADGDGAVARPGHSEHHTGRALDLGGPDGLLDVNTPSEMGRWVRENAHTYGFIVRYTAANSRITGYMDEPWHITYVGEAIAQAMVQGGYGSLEEYVAKNPGAQLP